jgi:hypothetical protein
VREKERKKERKKMNERKKERNDDRKRMVRGTTSLLEIIVAIVCDYGMRSAW